MYMDNIFIKNRNTQRFAPINYFFFDSKMEDKSS